MLGIFVKPNPKAFRKDVLSAERRVAASACLKETVPLKTLDQCR